MSSLPGISPFKVCRRKEENTQLTLGKIWLNFTHTHTHTYIHTHSKLKDKCFHGLSIVMPLETNTPAE